MNDLLPAVRRRTGLVAILDALGTADYSLDRVRQYLAALDELLKEPTQFAQDQAHRFITGFTPNQLTHFVFQDSVVLAYECSSDDTTLNEIVWFSHMLRTFEGGAFQRKLLFRGAWAWGDLFVVSSATSTVLGPAVRDAARWYELADWIGIHATPRTGLFVQALVDQGSEAIDFVLVDYDVPMKAGPRVPLKAVNWPKNLHLRQPVWDSKQIRGTLGLNLVVDAIGPGVERKHLHALKFFDDVVEKQKLQESWHTRLSAKAKNPAQR